MFDDCDAFHQHCLIHSWYENADVSENVNVNASESASENASANGEYDVNFVRYPSNF